MGTKWTLNPMWRGSRQAFLKTAEYLGAFTSRKRPPWQHPTIWYGFLLVQNVREALCLQTIMEFLESQGKKTRVWPLVQNAVWPLIAKIRLVNLTS